MLTKSDKSYLLTTYATQNQVKEIVQLIHEMNQKIDHLITVTSNSAGEIRNIQEELTVLSHHSIENFEENQRQNHRLDSLELAIR